MLNLHGYRYQQHVQALEDGISAVANPDVPSESHEK